ncbi:transcriptional regulator, PadR family [Paenisporosarcina quisquiliarum]|jgi:DNA-binding PadR family transcriptional regulator|uniref:PadR family transcriptional regulator n=1 Tax=Psychrobacillus psychrodurans TaxID=126157 RepID=A0A9X3L8T0_9BACI|nr:PadR family transcriptional regulator [Psychrobacillus psychrodurans]MCK1998510.1 PadR family transcriptional regulator [Psychrobacillus psychrodurans]MCZ8533320.1 PadR family transcriptional regulator [Psychrobacillus psychrodurans]SEN17565.1 transcriptional regulator, PadR family [Paenisporosarcina quisquiliarum]
MEKLLGSLITELRRGTLTLAVLSQLRTPQYGYSLVQLLEESSVTIEQSTLYPLLRRLEKQELVESSWDTTESRPRKYYVLSEYGVEILEQLKAEWEKSTKELQNLLKGDVGNATD